MKPSDIAQLVKVWGVKGVWNAARRMPAIWQSKFRFVLNIVKNRKTVPVKGITIVADIGAPCSLSKTMRDFAVMLKAAGIPFQVIDIGSKHSPSGRARQEDYVSLLTGKCNLLKYEYVVEMVTSPLPKKLPVKRCRIVFWEGEHGLLDVFPYLLDSNAVIAMSDFNFRYFRQELPASIAVCKVRYPLLPLPEGVLDKASARKRFDIGNYDFVVFYNFDLRSGSRKNAEDVLDAFALAFGGDSTCKLLLKINSAKVLSGKMAELMARAEKLGIRKQLVAVTDYLSQTDLYSLTNACDVYLSLHHAEGFGLGVAESMQMGKAVVVTAYSSTNEFCNDNTAMLVPYEMAPIDETGFVSYMREWAKPDVQAAAEKLKLLRSDQELRAKLGCEAKKFVEDYFSVANFRQSIEEFFRQV